MRLGFSSKIIISIFAVLALVLVLPSTTFADSEGMIAIPTGSCPGASTCSAGLCTGGAVVGKTACNYSWTDIQNTIVRIGNWIFGIIGIIVLLSLIYGGFLWLISGGKTELVDKGRKIMVGSLIGLIIVFSAPVLVKFVLIAIGTKDEIVDKIPVKDPITGTGGSGAGVGAGAGSAVTPTYECRCVVGIYKECLVFSPGETKNVAVCKLKMASFLDSKAGTDDFLKDENNLNFYKSSAICTVVTEDMCP